MIESGLKGWGAVVKLLKDLPDERATEIANLARRVGVHGGPALSYATRLLLNIAGHRDGAPPAPPNLSGAEADHVRKRVDQLAAHARLAPIAAKINR